MPFCVGSEVDVLQTIELSLVSYFLHYNAHSLHFLALHRQAGHIVSIEGNVDKAVLI